MSRVSEIEDRIKQLDPTEREELFWRIPFLGLLPRDKGFFHERPDHPGIVRTPDVCGGAARIIRTRILVWTLERMRQLGISKANILLSYPSLRAVDLVEAWSYADQHRDEVEKEIRENEED